MVLAYRVFGSGSCFHPMMALLLFSASEAGDHPTVHVYDLAADIVGGGGGDLQTSAGQLVWTRSSPRGSPRLNPGIKGWIIDQRLVHVGQHVAWTDSGGLDAQFLPLGRHGLGEHLDA